MITVPRAIRLRIPVSIWGVALVGIATMAVAGCGGSNSEDTANRATEDSAELVTTSTAAPTAGVSVTPIPTTSDATVTTVRTAEETPNDEVINVAYNNDFSISVAPILAEHCASCHATGGPGTGHWTLATAEDAANEAIGIAASVAIGFMPPWPASHDSIAFAGDRSLSESEIEAVVAWAKAGGELDVDPTTTIEATGQLGLREIDAVVVPAEPYAGSLGNTDDYRCQIYDPELTEATALTGYDFVPDQTEVVHHAIGFLLPASSRQAAIDKDAATAGAGWECYGGSGVGGDELLIGWAPGQDAAVFPDGSGYVLEPGDFVVLQIHYHYETSAPADASELFLDYGQVEDLTSKVQVRQYVAPAEIPCTTEQDGPLCDRDAAMEAAIARFGTNGVQANGINAICGVSSLDFAHMTDGIASSSCDLPIYGFGEIVSVLGHEHEIGASFRMTLNPDTPDELVLLDIPEWNFDWQYNYVPQETILLSLGDTVRIECSWDRSLQKPGIEPRYILWADGTNDEMCFSTIVTRS